MIRAERIKAKSLKWLMEQKSIVVTQDAADALMSGLRVSNWPKTYAADALRYAMLGLGLEKKEEDEEGTHTGDCNDESCVDILPTLKHLGFWADDGSCLRLRTGDGGLT